MERKILSNITFKNKHGQDKLQIEENIDGSISFSIIERSLLFGRDIRHSANLDVDEFRYLRTFIDTALAEKEGGEVTEIHIRCFKCDYRWFKPFNHEPNLDEFRDILNMACPKCDYRQVAIYAIEPQYTSEAQKG